MSDIITLAHGSGGKKTHQLIDKLFHKHFNNELLMEKADSALFSVDAGRLAFTTDSYVITPIEFPSADIGKIAVCGTVNDLAVCGAKPLYLSCGFIIEEGFEMDLLERIVKSMASACEEAKVRIVTGDTKVVPRGACDKIFINTSGIGVVPDGVHYSKNNIKEGDKVIISGTIGDHESTILIARENFSISAEIESDCAPLNEMIGGLVLKFGSKIHVMRDVTRGGLASTLNEFMENSSISVRLVEENIPMKQEVRGICEMLGLEPMYMANEGKIIMFADDNFAQEILAMMKSHKYGQDAAIIGEVINDGKGKVFVRNNYGGTRIVDMLMGEQLPRIC